MWFLFGYCFLRKTSIPLKGHFFKFQRTFALPLVDLNSKYLIANKTALKWFGYQTLDRMIGHSYCDMPCKASEQHEYYVHQDKITSTRNNTVKILGHYCYSNNNWKLLLGEKYPLKNKQGDLIGLVLHFNDITNLNLINVSKFLDITTHKNALDTHIKQIGYILEESYPNTRLPERQSECLFYLLRGKTAKEIAKLLNLSPRTVESYIEQIKFKLNCRTKSDLIETAIKNDYMNIIPKQLLK